MRMFFPSIALVFVCAVFVAAGCVPSISYNYNATINDDEGQRSGSELLFKVTPSVDMVVRGSCYPEVYGCRVIITWFFPKGELAKFSEGDFVARDAYKHDIKYDSTVTVSGKSACRGDCDINKENGSVTIVQLGDDPPKEFELVMPRLIVNGEEKEVPIIYFKRVLRPWLEPIIVNY